ncbi:BRCT domain-containing protein [uncultured Desulfuromusa sp.]|uniref:BRCT domain-containing protein n=1 Tax=uncultured Desulfuromusa sp. TaxID=219183 RepID=UPI002AA7D85A|nr:BRCT domain-containing protein [uncultured Desulfuromusa sp.]
MERFSRKEGTALIEAQERQASGSVSKKNDYVVAGSEAGSKLTKAEQLRITILSENDFLELIGMCYSPPERTLRGAIELSSTEP